MSTKAKKSKMKNGFILVILLSISMITFSQEKTFIREYYYKASETDSKVSSRQKALKEVKVELIEELGTYVESYVNYEITEENNKITRDFFTNEIKTLSAGTTETKILEESWDGYEYYVKAEINADPEEVLKRINQTLSIRRTSVVIDSLELMLTSSQQEFGLQREELEKVTTQLEIQNLEVAFNQEKLSQLNEQLIKSKQQLLSYQVQEEQILTEIQSIEEEITNSANIAVKNVRLYMTRKEVRKVCGAPRIIDYYNFNYGSVWVIFESDIVKGIVDSRDYSNDEQMSILEFRNARFLLK